MSRSYLATVLVVCAAAGCAQSVYPVKGRVHYADGSPVKHGRVVAETGGPTGSWGLIRPDGTFDLGTHAADDGIPPGSYRVSLQNTDTFPPAGAPATFVPQPLVHAKYAKPDTSGLAFDVPATRVWDITVEKP